MDALNCILDELIEGEEDLYDLAPMPAPAPAFETPRERAERERRDARDRQRRSRDRRRERDEVREQELLAREAALERREAELAAWALDTAIVEGLRVVLRRAGIADTIRSQADLMRARVSLHNLMGEVIHTEVTASGQDRPTTVRDLNDRLFR